MSQANIYLDPVFIFFFFLLLRDIKAFYCQMRVKFYLVFYGCMYAVHDQIFEVKSVFFGAFFLYNLIKSHIAQCPFDNFSIFYVF